MGLDFKRILCPVDLSNFSLEAVKLAVKVTESSGATLYLCTSSTTRSMSST